MILQRRIVEFRRLSFLGVVITAAATVGWCVDMFTAHGVVSFVVNAILVGIGAASTAYLLVRRRHLADVLRPDCYDVRIRDAQERALRSADDRIEDMESTRLWRQIHEEREGGRGAGESRFSRGSTFA